MGEKYMQQAQQPARSPHALLSFGALLNINQLPFGYSLLIPLYHNESTEVVFSEVHTRRYRLSNLSGTRYVLKFVYPEICDTVTE